MRKQKGFTLIELLIVVAIIGIIAAIAIPNLLDAIERSRQKRSTGEIKTMATGLQSFSTDFGGYPASGGGSVVFDNAFAATFTDTDGTPVIVPDLIQNIPIADGWGTPYSFASGPGAGVATPRLNAGNIAEHFLCYSLGSDRAISDPGAAAYSATDAEGDWLATPPTPPASIDTHCYQADIIWGDSSFLRAPEGKQKKC